LIIVEAPRPIAERILWDLEQSDQRVEQVVLEAMVVVMSPENGLRFGLDMDGGFAVGDSALNLSMSGLAVAGQYGPPDLATIRSFTYTSALLKALAREGYVSIRAAPRVMAKDGETAKITIAKETFFSIQPGNAQLLFRQDIERIEAGISLDITPVIRGDDVTVHIERAEVSEGLDNKDLADQGANTFPIINRRKVSTTVHVHDGETITIGGLVQRQEVERINKLPYLCDIPHVGRLFQHIDRREEENEVVIFICPRIVREGIVWAEPLPQP
jgi:type II secretory pathway component GspD/PulD (secretin)